MEALKPIQSLTSSSGQWQCFSICHWNLNSITAHNYAKSSLLTAYNLVHSFEIICISDIYLSSETPPNDTCLELPGYNLFCSGHPFNTKIGISVYNKLTLPLRILNISNLDTVSTLRSVLPTKFAALSSPIDLPVKSRASFKNLNQI